MFYKAQVVLLAVGLLYTNMIMIHCTGSKTVYTIPEQMELFCVSSQSVTITNIIHHLCVHRCMTADQCWGISYNKEDHICVMALEECSELQPHTQFNFQRLATVCTSWVPYTRGDEYPVGMEVTGIYGPGVKQEGDLYAVGSFSPSNQGTVWGYFNGASITHGDNYDVLVVDSHCNVIWEDHTAGDAIPEGAVQAGYYGPGTVSYLIRQERGTYDPIYSSYRQGDNYAQIKSGSEGVNITEFQLYILK